jgi:NCS2 family nucleobase:cation symporter-2
MIAGVTNYNGLNYVDTTKIADADPITFLWTTTFPLGLYGPAVIPLLIGFMVTTVETVGDVTATYEASELDTTTQRYDESIQGGLAADSLLSVFSALATSMPMTTFSQNNGVIALVCA